MGFQGHLITFFVGWKSVICEVNTSQRVSPNSHKDAGSVIELGKQWVLRW